MFKKNFSSVIKKNLLNNCEFCYKKDLKKAMSNWDWDAVAQDIIENKQLPSSWDEAKARTFEYDTWINHKQVIALIYWAEVLNKTDFLKYLKDC